MIKLARFLKPYLGMTTLVVILTFAQTLAQLYLPTLMADIVDIGIVQGDVAYIWRTGAWMLGVALLGSACIIVASLLAARAGTAFSRDIRGAIFRRVSNFSLHEFDTIGTASLITRTTNDVTQVHQVTVMILRLMVMAPIMAVGGIIMSLSKDPTLSLIFVVVLPALAAFIVLLASKGLPLFQSMQRKLDRLNKVLREQLSGIRVVRAFNRTKREAKRFEEANRDLTVTAIRVNRIFASMFPMLMLLMNFTAVGIIWFGAKRIDTGAMQVGDLMAFIQYSMQIMFSFLMAAMMFVMIPRAQASAKRINEVLATEPEITDPPTPLLASEQLVSVRFDDVTFSYPGAEEPAVQNISFDARKGEITAIIGGTGSGKSTLLNLIVRFYDVDSGRVLVNGLDVRDQSQSGLRERIGYVPQQPVLFSGTFAENVEFGNAGVPEDEIVQAIETSQAREFVDVMTDGIESTISQDGTNISGGQKQRISIARALVRRPDIYLFDDSFSALDFKTDANLRAALRSELQDSAVLIVAQRVATIMRANKIVVIDNGRVVGIGTHRELMEESEVYRQIVLSQLSMEEIA